MELQSKKYIYHGEEYFVYSDGRIYGPSGAEISHRPNHNGYATVILGSKKNRRKRVFVHRTVAELSLENPTIMDFLFLDGIAYKNLILERI